jgi:hypothetical protein
MRIAYWLVGVPVCVTAACGGTDAKLGSGPDAGGVLMATDAATMDAVGAISTDAGAVTGDDSAVTPSVDAAAVTPSVDASDDATFTVDAQATSRDAVVMFDGTATWEWDGTNWVNRSPALAPSARSWTAMASIGTKVVLFGGSNGFGVLGDTWEWDGTSWTQLLIPGPDPREGALMAAYQGKVVLFGGLASAGTPAGKWDYHDTWVFDGASWTLQGTSIDYDGPSAAWGMGEATAPSTGCYSTCPSTVLVAFGTGLLQNQTIIWDGSGWSTIDVAESNTNVYPPPYQSLLTSLGGSVLLFQDQGPTWQWTGGEWTQVPPAVGPGTGNDWAMAALAGSAVVYASSDTWVWSAGAWVQAAPATSPGFHSSFAMATRFAH